LGASPFANCGSDSKTKKSRGNKVALKGEFAREKREVSEREMGHTPIFSASSVGKEKGRKERERDGLVKRFSIKISTERGESSSSRTSPFKGKVPEEEEGERIKKMNLKKQRLP